MEEKPPMSPLAVEESIFGEHLHETETPVKGSTFAQEPMRHYQPSPETHILIQQALEERQVRERESSFGAGRSFHADQEMREQPIFPELTKERPEVEQTLSFDEIVSFVM
jgi:hypothetical protein